jgi:kynurenine formamidase
MEERRFPRGDATESRRIVDLSSEIYDGMPVFSASQETVVFDAKTHTDAEEKYGEDALTTATMGVLLSDHGPTHTDAISHFDSSESAESIEELPLHMFYTSAICVDATDLQTAQDRMDAEALRGVLREDDLSVKKGDTVLFFTGHWTEKRESSEWLTNHGGLARDAAEWLADRGVVNIGIDAPSIDHADVMETKEYPAHNMCAEREVTNMENMANLDAVAGMRYTICAFPLKLRDGTGSPIRPVAIIED